MGSMNHGYTEKWYSLFGVPFLEYYILNIYGHGEESVLTCNSNSMN